MGRSIAFIYGGISYVIFLATFLYSIGFVGNILVPKSIDSGTPSPVGVAIITNLVLLSIFALQHSIMARPAFKKIWAHVIPKPVERSTYVLMTCIAQLLIFLFWQPMPTMTIGHLLFALVTTAYIIIAVLHLEEKDLIAQIGDEYLTYRREVPAFFPGFGRRR